MGLELKNGPNPYLIGNLQQVVYWLKLWRRVKKNESFLDYRCYCTLKTGPDQKINLFENKFTALSEEETMPKTGEIINKMGWIDIICALIG